MVTEITETAQDESFEQLLTFLRDTRGFDFTGYKRPTLRRRIAKRMQALRIEHVGDYRAQLEADSDEFVQLFNTILINVTSFFRDPEFWHHVRDEIVPRVIEAADGGPIRVWSTGCATGEEAYTIAMVLTEVLGIDAFLRQVKIYATDVDDDALATGRHASYAAKDVEPVPAELRERYFDRQGAGYGFRADLRRAVIFGRHDLIQDPPISRIDLLVSRNTLMYFNADVQTRILANFHFALKQTGFLLLGKSEVLVSRSELFASVDLKRRVFAKVPQGGVRLRAAAPAPLEVDGASTATPNWADATFEASPVAAFVIDVNGDLVLANHAGRGLFRLGVADLGRPLRDLELSYRPLELRSRLDEAFAERRAVVVNNVEWSQPTGSRWFDVTVTPLVTSGGWLIGAATIFEETTREQRLHDELDQSRRQMETAYEELQSTVEELETTNEELQSTNEELETTNEELQSTNEELETMNEELQSTNEELETINDELRLRTDDLNVANAFLESVLKSLRAGVAVVDGEQRVEVWNGEAHELWGLRAEEVRGEHLLNLDIGLPVGKLRVPIRAILTGRSAEEELLVEATNRRGRPFKCKVTVLPLLAGSGEVRGAILLMEEPHDGG